jgi:outer membrane protein OmpA-like peptidoglycan-associated protein
MAALLVAAAVSAVGVGSVAGAQEAGTLELTGFGRFTNFSQTSKFGDKIGAGGEFGLFIADRFSLEAAASLTNTRTSTGQGASYTPLAIRLLYHQPLSSDRLEGLVGLGYTHNFYGRAKGGGDDGVGALLGVEAFATSWLGLRVDATLDYAPYPFQFRGNDITRFGVQVGIVLRTPHHSEAPPPPPPAPAAAAPPPPPPPPPPPAAAPEPAPPPAPAPAPPPPAPVARSLVLEGVTFEVNQAVLQSQSSATLDRVAASLVANPDTHVEVAGYTDNTGSPAANLRLSQARADAVRTYLISKGVAPDHIVAKGYGPANPVASNATAAGRAQNRRVELHKIG